MIIILLALLATFLFFSLAYTIDEILPRFRKPRYDFCDAWEVPHHRFD